MASQIPLQLLITGDNKDAVRALLELRQRAEESERAAVKAANDATAAEKRLRQEYEVTRKTYQELASASGDYNKHVQDAARQRMGAAKQAYDAARQEAQGLRDVAKEASNVRSDAVKELNGALKEAAADYRDVQQAADAAGRAQKKAGEDAARAQKQAREELAATAQKYGQLAQSIPGGNIVGAAMGGRGVIRGQWRDVNRAMAMAGDGGNMDAGVLSQGATSAAALNDSLTGIRNVGIATAVASVGLHRLSEEWRQMGSDAVEADNLIQVSFGQNTANINAWSQNLQNKLGLDGLAMRKTAADFNLMFGAVGISGDKALEKSKELSQRVVDIASLRNISDKDAFEHVTSFLQGETEAGRRIGVFTNEQTTKAYAYAHGIAAQNSELTDQQKILARIGQLLEQTQPAAGDRERTANSPENIRKRAEAQAAIAERAIGQGSAAAAAQVDGLKTSLLGIVASNEGIAQSFGWIAYMGSELGMGIGALTAFGASISQLFLAYNALQIQKGINAGAETADTAATTANTTAKTANTVASTTAAGATLAEATAKDVESLAEEANAAATDANTASKVANTAASTTATGAAGLLGTAFSMAGIAVAGVGVAAAAAFSAVAYSCAQSIGWVSKEQSFVDRLAQGWKNVRDYATGHNGAWDQNEADLAEGIAKIKTENSEAVLKGTKTQEQADKDARQAEAKLREDFAREDMKIGDKEHMVANQQAAAQLRAQDKAMSLTPAAMPAAAVPASGITPATPGATTPLSASVPVLGSGGNALGMSVGASSGGGVLPDTDPFATQVLVLGQQIRDARRAKNKELADDLTTQLKNIQQAQKNWKAAHRAQEKEDKAAERLAKKQEREAEKRQKVEDSDAVAFAKAQNDEDAADAIAELQDRLDKAKEDGNRAQIGALTRQIEVARARQKYNDALAQAAASDDEEHRHRQEGIAAIHFRADMRRAQRAGDKAMSDSGGSRNHDLEIHRALALRHMGSGRGIESVNLSPSFERSSSAYGGSGMGGARGPMSVDAELQMHQDSRGNTEIHVKVPPIKLPNTNISAVGGF